MFEKEVLDYPDEEVQEEIEAQIEEDIESEEEVDTEPYVPHTGLPEILVVQEGVTEDIKNQNTINEKAVAEKIHQNNIAKEIENKTNIEKSEGKNVITAEKPQVKPFINEMLKIKWFLFKGTVIQPKRKFTIL